MTLPYQPQGFALDIFQKRHAIHDKETWLEASGDRVPGHVAAAETGDNIARYKAAFADILTRNLFMPGGRIWYGSGRPKGQLLNCFVSPTADSREGWGRTTSDMIVICGTGGGLGNNFSPVRPRGAPIHGTGGKASGSVSLMRIVNAAGEEMKAGGGRRTALMFALGLTHGDIVEFLDAKLDLGQLNNANVSVVFDDNPELFFEKVRGNEQLELTFRGQVIGKVPAVFIWNKIIKNALTSGEPGLLNGYLANRMSNVWYYKPLICTNPCFAPGTMIQTREGHYPIESLVGRTVEVWDGLTWVSCNNFRVTGENQEMVRITMQDGSYERVTPYHSCILEDGTRVDAQNLTAGMRLKYSEAPLTHGNVTEPGAYLKGFLTGNGSKDKNNDRPLLVLYAPKHGCADRLVLSALEIPATALPTNGIEAPSFGETDCHGRQLMRGLTARRDELLPWVEEYRERLPAEAFTWDIRSKCEFIAGVMDSDGTTADTAGGWLYQVSSIRYEWLRAFQMLLKTIGVASKLALMKKAATKDFGARGGLCETKDCWRLTISQVASIVLATQVKFSRLVSFANKQTTYRAKSRANTVESVTTDGVEERVYCCTIDGTHSLGLSSGFHWGQCGEIWLIEYDCCCLGALVLPRFVTDNGLDWALLRSTVHTAVRFLDDVLTVNNYPLPEIQETCSSIRRIGLGIMGLHDMLLMMCQRYNTPQSLELVDKLMAFIKNEAYEASVDLAKEKGAFPEFDAEKFLKSGFAKTLKPTLRSKIREFGIRNCALLTIAPTGTTSMECDVTSGIEPAFGPAWKRRYRDGDVLKEEIVIHPLFKRFIEEGRDVSHFQSAYDLDMRDHFEMQAVCQRHLDNACSKTINVPAGTSAEELSDLYMEFFPVLKGVTVYPEGSRENQPITPMTYEDAMKHLDATGEGALSGDTCRIDGTCG